MEANILNALINIDSTFTSLYELKFKGRKVLEDISNCIYQRELMIKGRFKDGRYMLVFERAIGNVEKEIGQLAARF